MSTDGERWRFLSAHNLTLHTDGGDYGYMVHWCRTAGSGEPPKFYPISTGRTAEEAVDRAIERWERKHGRAMRTASSEEHEVRRLEVRGWVS